MFWVEQEVVFPTILYRRISFQIVPKGRLLYFNAIIPGELIAQL